MTAFGTFRVRRRVVLQKSGGCYVPHPIFEGCVRRVQPQTSLPYEGNELAGWEIWRDHSEILAEYIPGLQYRRTQLNEPYIWPLMRAGIAEPVAH